MMKTCQTSIKQSNPKKWERERYKMEGPKSRQKERTTNKGRWQGDMNKSNTKTLTTETYQIRRGKEHLKEHFACKNHLQETSDKEKEGTPERTLACKNHLRQQQPERKLFYFPLFEHPHRCTVCDPEQ